MSDFKLITNRYQFSSVAKEIWADHYPGPMKGFLNAPHGMPCLASIFVANGSMAVVILDKKAAKRLIYPKTNKRRVGMRWFDWIDGDLDEEIKTYVSNILSRNKVDGKQPAQAARVNELMRQIKGRKGPVLMANRSYKLEDTKVVDFFLVTKELASTLVYYNKNKKGDAEEVIDELFGNDGAQPGIFDLAPDNRPVVGIAQPVEVPSARRKKRPEDFPFFINIDRHGVISINTLDVFKTQINIPRFSDNREADISQWEVACIKDINITLENTQVDVEGTIAIAKDECKKFLAKRQLSRINHAVMYKDAWVNKNQTDPEIRAIIQQGIQ